MYFKSLPKQCQFCSNLKVISLHMDGKHEYGCGKYPITKLLREGCDCPRFDGELPANGGATHGRE